MKKEAYKVLEVEEDYWLIIDTKPLSKERMESLFPPRGPKTLKEKNIELNYDAWYFSQKIKVELITKLWRMLKRPLLLKIIPLSLKTWLLKITNHPSQRF